MMSSTISWDSMNASEKDALMRAGKAQSIFACHLDDIMYWGANDFSSRVCIRLEGWGLLELHGFSDTARTQYVITDLGREILERAAQPKVTVERPTTITAGEYMSNGIEYREDECSIFDGEQQITRGFYLAGNDIRLEWGVTGEKIVARDYPLTVRWLDTAQTERDAEAGSGGDKVQGVFLETFRKLHDNGTQLHPAQITYLFSLVASLQAEREDLQKQVNNLKGVEQIVQETYDQIWDAVYPAKNMGRWDYPAQIARHVGDKIDELARKLAAAGAAVKPFVELWEIFEKERAQRILTNSDYEIRDFLNRYTSGIYLQNRWRELVEAAAALKGE